MPGFLPFANKALDIGGSFLGGLAGGQPRGPDLRTASANSFAEMNSPFNVGGGAIANQDPVSRIAGNLTPILLTAAAVWLIARR